MCIEVYAKKIFNESIGNIIYSLNQLQLRELLLSKQISTKHFHLKLTLEKFINTK